MNLNGQCLNPPIDLLDSQIQLFYASHC
jgi:hypothetical protein